MFCFFTMNILTICFVGIKAHSNMFKPTPRGNKEFSGYCSRGQGCLSACETTKELSPFNYKYSTKKVVKRGDKLNVQWYRQNHPGGFVRLSIVQMEKSDSLEEFDNSAVKYVCYETNCKESEENDMLGKLNGGGSTLCSTDVTIPDNLQDGAITLQWTWFGGGIYFAEQNTTFANYVSCSDMLLEGGSDINTYSNTKPYFQGGDAGNVDNGQCRYWSSTKVGECAAGSEQGDKCGNNGVKNGVPQM